MLFGDSWPALHGAITHFPVALLLTAAFFDFCAAIFKKPKLRETSLLILGLAVLSCIPTIITGREAFASLFSKSTVYPPELNNHVIFAYTLSGCALLLLIWRLVSKDKLSGIAMGANVLLSLAIAVMVGYTGHLGGEMVFGSGDSSSNTAPPPTTADPKLAALITSGAKVYASNGCSSCHAINGVGGHGGPDLTHEGTQEASIDWQIAHLKNPVSKSPGSTMPPYNTLSPSDLNALATYLVNLK